MESSRLSRREFLECSALSLGGLALPRPPGSAGGGAVVDLIVERDDRVAAAPAVQWAVRELAEALRRRGVTLRPGESIELAPAADLSIVVTSREELLRDTGAPLAAAPESLALVPSSRAGKPALIVSGRGARGVMYGLLELLDRVEGAEDPLRALRLRQPVVERPFNAVRAIGRPFVSDVEDLSWFRDRAFWPPYFAMLARQRFNRFHLALGLGYDTLRWVTDAYLLYAYPFLVGVPGYDVRAVNLPDAEREQNLEAVRFISHEAAAHGIDFQLGLWTHGWTWDESPKANYTIAGLTAANQAAYSRDALAAVLRACPDITGVTLRTHYESGIGEGNYAFWRTIFDGVPQSGRVLEIELHAKGLDQRMIDSALALGVPVRVSPKYWAEHTGLPYHQAAIRELELPHEAAGGDTFSTLSLGARNHTRYGYADFLQEGRAYGVMFRVFPGAHKLLLWGDPVTAAAHARAFRFCGSDGAELFEPLAFKGRRGSGTPRGRLAYADASLATPRDWEKYLYTYRTWGRLLYDPDAAPDSWRRQLRADYGAAAPQVEAALGAATRIFPVVVTAHLPSAAHDTYSPECYTNQSIVDPGAPSPYGDTPAPKIFGKVSPLDPQLFSTIDEHAAELVGGTRSGKYSPVEVAQWLDDLAARASRGIEEAERASGGAPGAALRRAAIDVRVQAGIGRFFAAKLRAGVLYAIYQASRDRGALEAAIRQYRLARDAWSRAADEAKSAYLADITFGPLPHQRGHWLDRLAAIDADLAAMEARLAASAQGAPRDREAQAAIARVAGGETRVAVPCRHTPPEIFLPGSPVDLAIAVEGTSSSPTAVRLHYRHVNQAERYQAVEMRPGAGTFAASIAAAYTDSPFPLQYYFEVRQGPGTAWLYPGLGAELTNQPYFVVRQRKRL